MMFDEIFCMGSVLDALIAAVGELVMLIFSVFANAITDLCTMEGSFQDTFNELLFGAKGIFRNSDSLFSEKDPTKLLSAAGSILLFGLMIIELFKSMFGSYVKAESPEKIIGKGLFYTVVVSYYHIWANGILSLLISPIYKSFEGVSAGGVGSVVAGSIGESFKKMYEAFQSWDFSAAEAAAGTVATTTILSTNPMFVGTSAIRGILFIILAIPIGVKFFAFIIEIVERYLQIFFITLFGPLCLACGVTPSTETVAKKWFSSWLNSMIIMCVNIFFVKLSLIAVANFAANMASGLTSAGFIQDVVIPFFATYSVLKIACETDNIANKLGLNTIQASGMGAAMWGGGLSMVMNKIMNHHKHSNFNKGNQNGALAQEAAGGNSIAAISNSLMGKGMIGAVVGTAVAQLSPAAAGALAMDKAEKSGGIDGIMGNCINTAGTSKGFAAGLAQMAHYGKTGNINGAVSKQNLTRMLGLTDTKITSAFVKNGEITAKTADGRTFHFRPHTGEGDVYGASVRDKQGQKNTFNEEMDGQRWVGYATWDKIKNGKDNKDGNNTNNPFEGTGMTPNNQSNQNVDPFNNVINANEQITVDLNKTSKEEVTQWAQAVPVENEIGKHFNNTIEITSNSPSTAATQNTYMQLNPHNAENQREKVAGQFIQIETKNGVPERYNLKPNGKHEQSLTGNYFKVMDKDGNARYIPMTNFSLTNKRDSHGNYIPQSFNIAGKELLYRDNKGQIGTTKVGEALPQNFSSFCYSPNGSPIAVAAPNQKVHIGDTVNVINVLNKMGEAPETVKGKDGKERKVLEPELDFFVNIDSKDSAPSSTGHHVHCAISNGAAIVIPPSAPGESVRAVAQTFNESGEKDRAGQYVSIGYDEKGERVYQPVNDAIQSGIIHQNTAGQYLFNIKDGETTSCLTAVRNVDSNGKTSFSTTAGGETFTVDSSFIRSTIIPDEDGQIIFTDNSSAEAGEYNLRNRYDKKVNKASGHEYFIRSDTGEYVLPAGVKYSKDTPPDEYKQIASEYIRDEVVGTVSEYYVNDIKTDKNGDVEFGSAAAVNVREGITKMTSEYGQTIYACDNDCEVVHSINNNPESDTASFTVPLERTDDGSRGILAAANDVSGWTRENLPAYKAIVYQTLEDESFFQDNNIKADPGSLKLTLTNEQDGVITSSVSSKSGIEVDGKKDVVTSDITFYRTDMYQFSDGVVPEGVKRVVLPDGKEYHAVSAKNKNVKLDKIKKIIRRNGSRISNL